jgi:hypothetical protein
VLLPVLEESCDIVDELLAWLSKNDGTMFSYPKMLVKLL